MVAMIRKHSGVDRLDRARLSAVRLAWALSTQADDHRQPPDRRSAGVGAGSAQPHRAWPSSARPRPVALMKLKLSCKPYLRLGFYYKLNLSQLMALA